MLAATFDIGTTAVKAVVVNENGEPAFTGSSVNGKHQGTGSG